MTISIRLNEKDTELIRKYAQMNGITVSDLVRQSVLERIEDEHDLAAYEKAILDLKQDARIYTLDEVESELGLK